MTVPLAPGLVDDPAAFEHFCEMAGDQLRRQAARDGFEVGDLLTFGTDRERFGMTVDDRRWWERLLRRPPRWRELPPMTVLRVEARVL